MEMYIAVIMTVWLATQIIRVIQNAIQLSKYGEIYSNNKLITRVYEKLERWLDLKLEELENEN